MGLLKKVLALLTSGATGDEFKTKLGEILTDANVEQLAEVEKGLQDHFDEQRQQPVTDETLTTMVAVAGAVDVVREHGQKLNEAADARAAQVAEIAGRIHPEGETEANTEEGAAEGETEGAEAKAGTETAPVAQDAAEGQGDGTDGTVEVPAPVAETPPAAEPVPEPELVPAAATPAPTLQPGRPTAQQMAEHVAPGAIDAILDQATPVVRVRSAGYGGELAGLGQVDELAIQQWGDLEGTDVRGKVRVARVTSEYPKSRQINPGRITDMAEIAEEIRAKACEPGGTEALVADGGICGPVDTRYDLMTIANARRTLKAAVGGYQTRRGGLRFDAPLRLSDIRSSTTPTSGYAIGRITEAQDAASTYDKSVQTLTCGASTEKRVAAWYRQWEFGNFMARSNPERTGQFTQLVMAAFARFTEQQLFLGMRLNSIEVNAPQRLGAVRDWLTALNQQAIGYRQENRMDPEAVLDIVAPVWVGNGLLPDDMTRALQAYPEQFDVTRAWVESKLRARNINVLAWYEDDYSTAASSGGSITPYPSSFYTLMFHPGAHVVIDGGELDLGVFRDSNLVNNNTFREFAEEWWETAMWGVESLSIEFALCANGASAGSRTPTCGS